MGGPRIEAAHLVLVVDLDGFAESGDLDHGDAVADEADEANGLGHVAVDPLLVATAVGVATRLVAQLVLGRAQRGENHPVVHSDENVVRGDGFLQRIGESVGVGLLAEVFTPKSMSGSRSALTSGPETSGMPPSKTSVMREPVATSAGRLLSAWERR